MTWKCILTTIYQVSFIKICLLSSKSFRILDDSWLLSICYSLKIRMCIVLLVDCLLWVAINWCDVDCQLTFFFSGPIGYTNINRVIIYSICKINSTTNFCLTWYQWSELSGIDYFIANNAYIHSKNKQMWHFTMNISF